MLHERLNPHYDKHIIWWNEENVYYFDIEVFMISEYVDDSKLDEYFIDLGTFGRINKIEGFKV